MSFNCSKCGLCCQYVGVLVESVKRNLINPAENSKLLQEIASFPYKYSKSGRCEKLSFENECTIYETRPLMCQVDGMHKKYFMEYSQTEFYELNEQQCNLLKSKIK